MLRDMGKHSNEYLWYAIVGATSMYLDQKITKETYDILNQTFRHDVAKFNPSSAKLQKGQI